MFSQPAAAQRYHAIQWWNCSLQMNQTAVSHQFVFQLDFSFFFFFFCQANFKQETTHYQSFWLRWGEKFWQMILSWHIVHGKYRSCQSWGVCRHKLDMFCCRMMKHHCSSDGLTRCCSLLSLIINMRQLSETTLYDNDLCVRGGRFTVLLKKTRKREKKLM